MNPDNWEIFDIFDPKYSRIFNFIFGCEQKKKKKKKKKNIKKKI